MSSRIFFCCLLAAVLVVPAAQAQPNNNPCNEGRVPPPRTEPRHAGMLCMRPWGIMTGWLTKCVNEAKTEDFGSNVVPLGDVNHDDVADFSIERIRCDTAAAPLESYVYFGVRGALPDTKSGQRIGPTEILSITRILCSGDWDADGNRDLLTQIHIKGDTAGGDTAGYGVERAVIFWGTESGAFSIDDTTRLIAYSELWLGVDRAVSVDLDGDGVDDLCVDGGGSIANGKPVRTANMFFYQGQRGNRWGRNGAPRTAALAWWNAPPITSTDRPSYKNTMKVVDQDCDGYPDIALLDERASGSWSTAAVLYGRAGMLPDTLSTETVDLTLANGHAALLVDVTGDRVPELVVNAGSQEKLKVFAGRQGQRLRAMVGTGNEQGRPWLVVKLPKSVNPDDWFGAGFEPLYNLGDVDGDSIADIAVYNFPFFSIYTTGMFFDQYIDGGMWWGQVGDGTCLGDIDGSGRASWCIDWPGTPGGLAFYHATDSLQHMGEFTDPPHPEGFTCEHAAGIHDPGVSHHDEAAVALDVVPNPSRGEMAVTWRLSAAVTGVELRLVDAGGREVLHRHFAASATGATISTAGFARGFYLLILSSGTRSTTVRILVE